jgi:hypothetical protein
MNGRTAQLFLLSALNPKDHSAIHRDFTRDSVRKKEGGDGVVWQLHVRKRREKERTEREGESFLFPMFLTQTDFSANNSTDLSQKHNVSSVLPKRASWRPIVYFPKFEIKRGAQSQTAPPPSDCVFL